MTELKTYAPHPLADIFPLTTGKEFVDLKADISVNGLHEPIVVYEDQILDGRNRFRACQDVGVKPMFEQYAGDDPAGYVISLNLMRRHLNESQRAMVAGKLAKLERGRPEGNKSANLRNYPTQEEAAEKLNVSERSVNTAKSVQRKGTPALVESVEQGKVAVSTAATIAEVEPEEQEEIVARGPKEILKAAKEIRAKNKNIALKHTGDEESYTPGKYVEAARRVMGCIDLDPASNAMAQETVQAGVYFTVEDDGLEQQWSGNIWMNPPYTALVINKFLAKACQHYASGEVSAAIILTNNNTDTTWFHATMEHVSAVCFTRGRINFIKRDGKKSSPTNGQMFFYLGPDVGSFKKEFAQYGLVMVAA